MTKVFLGGSRYVSRLNDDVRARVDVVIEKGLPVVIGDANGADKALQAYLNTRGYRNVQVFCSNGRCRNNLGGWEIRAVPTETREASVEFYSAKDLAMAQEASVGLMVWDGKSVGTLCNVFRLLSQKKKAAVYSVPEKAFRELKTVMDWNEFIRHCKSDVRRKLEERTGVVKGSGRAESAQLSLMARH
ncbi:MAG: hypothetical protein WB615_00595 [Candidatus Tumulicola sp.]|jgi:hypothetical protein